MWELCFKQLFICQNKANLSIHLISYLKEKTISSTKLDEHDEYNFIIQLFYFKVFL